MCHGQNPNCFVPDEIGDVVSENLQIDSAREIIFASGFEVAFAVGRLQILFPAEGILFVQARLIIYQLKWTPAFCRRNFAGIMQRKPGAQIMATAGV